MSGCWFVLPVFQVVHYLVALRCPMVLVHLVALVLAHCIVCVVAPIPVAPMATACDIIHWGQCYVGGVVAKRMVELPVLGRCIVGGGQAALRFWSGVRC